MKIATRYQLFILLLLFGLVSKQVLAAPYVITMSELDFSDFLPITGNCEMDLTGDVTDLPGSQMCISPESGTVAHYRIIAPKNTNFNIRINSRPAENSDGLTFTPVGKITSEVDDIDIVPGQTHVANSGLLGRIDIQFGGQVILSNAFAFRADQFHEIEMEALLTWSEVP
ncbi:hypothetical protein Patl_1302 [Paraglaciecola sp. T6c]|nr:hypothetical protein Patl_1302 [Paraglaciecola sp. T6c]